MAEAKRDAKIKHLHYAKTLVSSKAFQLAFVRSDFGLIFESREHFFGVPIHPWPTENPSSLLLSSFYSSDLSSVYAMSRQSLPVWFLGPNITSVGLSWWMLQSSPSARCVKHSQTQEPSKESNLLSNISVWEHHKCIVLSSNWQDAFCLNMFKSYWRFLHIWGRTDWPQPYQTWDTLAFGPKQCLQKHVSVACWNSKILHQRKYMLYMSCLMIHDNLPTLSAVIPHISTGQTWHGMDPTCFDSMESSCACLMSAKHLATRSSACQVFKTCLVWIVLVSDFVTSGKLQGVYRKRPANSLNVSKALQVTDRIFSEPFQSTEKTEHWNASCNELNSQFLLSNCIHNSVPNRTQHFFVQHGTA